MNGNFNSYPSLEAQRVVNKATFDTSGTYVIPNNATFLYVFIVAAGGGGAGGARTASGTNATGGGGGGGGAFYHGLLFVPSIGGAGTTLNILLGAGGLGGSGATTLGGLAAAGGQGGRTRIQVNGKQGYLLSLQGGSGGSGGSGGGGGAGGIQSNCLNFRPSRITNGGAGGNSSAGGSALVQYRQDGSGAGGGGVSTANLGSAGGAVMCQTTDYQAGGVANPRAQVPANPTTLYYAHTIYSGGAVGANGTDSYLHIMDAFSPGLGGSGGGGGASSAGGRGGNGYRGGGGGGGGGARDPNNGGTGGNGGNAYCVIMAIS